jgi:hypothetical protein
MAIYDEMEGTEKGNTAEYIYQGIIAAFSWRDELNYD